MIPPQNDPAIFQIDRPHSRLLVRYLLGSLMLGPLFFIAFIPALIRYSTLQYRFDAEGVSMRWGLIFRREINLTYARIQDIHLSSGLVERWLGLARIEIQTASGSAAAEMVIEGLLEYAQVRDFLYAHMRGTSGPKRSGSLEQGDANEGLARTDLGEVTTALEETTKELRAIRTLLAATERTRGPDHG